MSTSSIVIPKNMLAKLFEYHFPDTSIGVMDDIKSMLWNTISFSTDVKISRHGHSIVKIARIVYENVSDSRSGGRSSEILVFTIVGSFLGDNVGAANIFGVRFKIREYYVHYLPGACYRHYI